MKIDNKKKTFEAHPAGQYRACLVDETPLKLIRTKFGEKEAFRFVFETELKRDDGSSWCVWSAPLTPSLGEKSNLRKLLRSWLGRDLEDGEGIDTEALIARPALVVVAHEIRDGVTYANLLAVLPDNGPNPVTPSGSYVRVRDRDGAGGGTSAWREVVVHVGANKGTKLGDLKPAQREALLEKWVPFLNDTASAEDIALRKALEDSRGNQPY